ncbi:hypothetical protein [Anditalea andensis]|uniref:CHRD domain-containing protein n=1 Tax=Anditalea andensis TaxID=1048983 RepID=A0A074L5U0_9BACT|nr:hypothetical protein [Anditalea andensis]KEO75870.1 hypothetical protein EL17_22895 [Anditalea andensis]
MQSKWSKIIVLWVIGIIWGCSSEEEGIYTQNQVSYSLTAASDFDIQGMAHVRELRTGGIEIELVLEGLTSTEAYFYPSHLHYGPYDSPNAPMAQMLSPVDARTLVSKTVITTLHDGSIMDFNRFLSFDGHIKVHLAEDGPDYEVILAVGNVGAYNERVVDLSKIAVCSPYTN